jgi:hypothetical protein
MREIVHHPDESGRFYDGVPDPSMSGVAILTDPFGQIKGHNAYHQGTPRLTKGSLPYNPKTVACHPWTFVVNICRQYSVMFQQIRLEYGAFDARS